MKTAIVVLFTTLLWTSAAYAQDAGAAAGAATPVAGATSPPTVPALPGDVVRAATPTTPGATPATTPAVTNPGADPDFLDKMFKAAETSNWRMLAVLIVIGAVWLLRTFGGKKWPVLKTDRAGAVATLVMGTAGAVGNAMAAGGAITPRLFLNGLMMGITAAGGWVVVKKLIWPSDVKKDAVPMAAPAPSAPNP